MTKKSNKDKIIEYIYTDKKGFKITLDFLEKLLDKSKSLNKEPLLVLSIKKNDKEIITLKCMVQIERK
jgi:hypothetical protein